MSPYLLRALVEEFLAGYWPQTEDLAKLRGELAIVHKLAADMEQFRMNLRKWVEMLEAKQQEEAEDENS